MTKITDKTNNIGIEILENEMNPQVNKNINILEQPAESLMNSFIEGKICNHQTEIIVHKQPDS
jgi:hypothetical protein